MKICTPLSAHAMRIVMLGAGELGKEVVIELQHFGVEVIACDCYTNAPAMQVVHRSHVVSMLDHAALREVIEHERPHLITMLTVRAVNGTAFCGPSGIARSAATMS